MFGGLAALYWPRTISYAYQERACIDQLTIAPDWFKSGTGEFIVQARGGWTVAGMPIAATQLCVVPTVPPQPGTVAAQWSLFGWVPGRPLVVATAARPQVTLTALAQPLPTSRPVTLALSAPDSIHRYALRIDDKSAACVAHDTVLRCPIETLQLAQGKEYSVQLVRSFGRLPASMVAAKTVTTLTAASVKDVSIKPNELITAKPRAATITFDKPIESAAATLTRFDGQTKVIVPVAVTPGDRRIEVAWTEDLARQAQFQLTVDAVKAQDGSTLVEPYVIPFRTSGGPKVTGMSVGKVGVALGSTAVITFDQPLSTTQDQQAGVEITGGATIVRRQANQLVVSFAGVPACTDVTIKITAVLESEHGVTGGSDWSQQTRTVCHSVSTIGQSVKGRAITAYTFGSGPVAALYTGAIHGNELSTRALMLRWIDELEAKARELPAGISVVVVPVVNPDGVATGTRTNGNNVDLNRNFGTSDWTKDISTVTNAPFPGGGGSTAMSEPETQAIASLVARLRPRVVASYHSIGSVVAANQAGASVAYAQQYAALSGYSNATGSATTFEYAISGTADDYYGQKLGVASILVELGSHTYHQFERNQKAMWALLK